ncbi:MAG: hypothetical protein WCX97_01810 [Candidatus Magasanikbacteria bacterium]
MYESIYRKAMTEAWHLVWRNKILWIFGLLSVMIGQFGLGDFVGKLLYWNDKAVHPFYLFSYVSGAVGILPVAMGAKIGIIWATLIILLLMLLAIFISVCAQGALVAAVADWYKSKKTDKLAVAWHKGVKHFWRVLSLNILEKLILGFLLIILAVAIGGLADTSVGGLLLIGAIFALIFFGALITIVVTIYSIGFVVVENRDLFSAMARGWRLFISHLAVSIELAVLLFFAGWTVLVFAFLGSFIVFLPSAGLWLLGGALGSSFIMWFGLIVGLILLTVMLVGSGAFFNAFTVSAWIYSFMKMKHTGITSRLVCGLEKLFRRG